MQQVRAMVGAGSSLSHAVRDALGRSLAEFGRAHGLRHHEVVHPLRGLSKPSPRLLEALVTEFGGDADAWRLLIWQAQRPRVASDAATPPVGASLTPAA